MAFLARAIKAVGKRIAANCTDYTDLSPHSPRNARLFHLAFLQREGHGATAATTAATTSTAARRSCAAGRSRRSFASNAEFSAAESRGIRLRSATSATAAATSAAATTAAGRGTATSRSAAAGRSAAATTATTATATAGYRERQFAAVYFHVCDVNRLTLASSPLSGDSRAANGKFKRDSRIATSARNLARPLAGKTGLAESEARHAKR